MVGFMWSLWFGIVLVYMLGVSHVTVGCCNLRVLCMLVRLCGRRVPLPLTPQTHHTKHTFAQRQRTTLQQLWRVAYTNWVTKELRTDDITVIVVDLVQHYKVTVSSSASQQPSEAANSVESGQGGGNPQKMNAKKKSRRGSTKLEIGGGGFDPSEFTDVSANAM